MAVWNNIRRLVEVPHNALCRSNHLVTATWAPTPRKKTMHYAKLVYFEPLTYFEPPTEIEPVIAGECSRAGIIPASDRGNLPFSVEKPKFRQIASAGIQRTNAASRERMLRHLKNRSLMTFFNS